jgi:uncharacterized membrane protein YphA (DoxX/SURF4 family)
MRTNPFLDVWQFVVGLTDVPYATGAFKYGFISLLFGLLGASVLIAWINRRQDPAQRTEAHIVICACRILVGCMWFQASLWKLPLPVADGFRSWTEQMGQYAAFAFLRTLVANVYLPYLSMINPLVFLAEMSFAVSLILGFGVGFFSALATLFCLHLWLGLYQHPSEWPWTYVFLALLHVQFVASSAGRSLGLDALLHRRDVTGFARAFG